MLVHGRWQRDWDPVQAKDEAGRFIRQDSQFRSRLSADQVAALGQSNGSNRYQLFVAYICPWASRTLIARQLLGLEPWIKVKVVSPVLSPQGWGFQPFPGSHSADQVGHEYLHELYTQAQPNYSGRVTVPVLWDDEQQQILNNESADILQIFNQDLRPVHASELDLRPAALVPDIDQFNERIYHRLNNGVYRAGFASSQWAYEEAFDEVFAILDELEQDFSQRQYAVADQLTESDIRLFVTLVRFDVAYVGLFKTNKKPLLTYSNISRYLDRLLQIKAFADNTKVDHIKAGYYSIAKLNPTGVIPKGPELPWFKWLAD